ncbi:MAG: chorismate synthase [Erysipelotrichaceae bacterium]|nr:chorismate synthase [Erysipelotrichaceae bacterium]
MRNVFGNNLTLTIFGESHGSKIGAIIDGMPGGIKIDEVFIKKCLSLRRPQGKNETQRIECDEFEIVSGVFNSYTTGSPLCIEIKNNDIRSKDYEKTKDLPRPSHADYVSHIKYNGYEDYRGGGHFSGRISAALVASGAIFLDALKKLNIDIGSHILQVGEVKDAPFKDLKKEIALVNELEFPVILNVKEQMEEVINNARIANDSVGGIIQVAINNLPVGLGEPMFSSLEGELAKAMFSIGAIKGIEFGLGFAFANKKASEVNDEFTMLDNKVITKTNNNGGINGGISNGMPILFNVVVKPTPSISIKQDTINLKTMENDSILITGRHDPAIIRRINIITRAMSAFVIADFLTLRYGNDVLVKGIK